MADSLGTQASNIFTLHRLAGLAALALLLIGTYFSQGFARGMDVAGIVCAAIAYFSK